jgi:hydrogenase-4 component F
MRFHILTQAVTGTLFSQNLLMFFGVFSVAVSVPFILQQNDYKRLFAYSSVEHMGLVAVGLGFGGTWGIFGALFHVINHAFNKSLLFFASGNLLKAYHTKEISKIRGVIKTSPFLGAIFFCAVLAIGGLPPFSVFVSEFTIMAGGFIAKQFLASALILLFLVFIFAGLLRQASRMTFGEPVASKPASTINPWMNAVLLAGIAIIFMMGVYLPSPLHRLIDEAVRIVQGTGGL